MLIAGCAWGIYSLRGRRSVDALGDNAGNFARSVPGTLVVSVLLWSHRSADAEGIVLAVLSGSIASGLGYAAWYTALPRLGAIAAANAQLSVPVIAALAGVILFSEPITLRLSSPLCWCSAGRRSRCGARSPSRPRELSATASGLAPALSHATTRNMVKEHRDTGTKLRSGVQGRLLRREHNRHWHGGAWHDCVEHDVHCHWGG